MREPLRVLWLINGLGTGGAERLLERSIPYLDRERLHYELAYLLPWKNALVPAFERASMPVHCLEFRRNFDLTVLRRLRMLLQRNRIDLVHAHLPVPGVLARFAKAGTNVKWLVYTEHNVPSRYMRMTRILNGLTYPMIDVAIAVSQAVAEQVQPYQRHGRPKLVTILNGVDIDGYEQAASREEICRQFGFPTDAYLIVNVANLVQKKGHRHLLSAAKRVIAVEPRARFLLVGGGPLWNEVAREARKLNLNGHVVLTGFREDAAALIGVADVFVLSSLHEGLPVSVLEAMAAARPVVATRVGGVPEVISRDTGVLVNPGDEQGLAAELVSLLRDPDRRRRLGEAARQHVRHGYGMAQMVAAVEKTYYALAHP